jgi:hypothetical protein
MRLLLPAPMPAISGNLPPLGLCKIEKVLRYQALLSSPLKGVIMSHYFFKKDGLPFLTSAYLTADLY